MTNIIVETARVARPADAIWRDIGEFGSIDRWHPMLAKVESEGEQIGNLRTAEARDGTRQVERLLEREPHGHLYRYRIESSRMPVRDYFAELTAQDNGDGTSTVMWSAQFDVASSDQATTADAVRTFFRVGLDKIRTLYGAAS